MLLGLVGGLAFAWFTPTVYCSCATIHVPVCRHGVASGQSYGTDFYWVHEDRWCPECDYEATPILLRLARRLDAALEDVSLPPLYFESAVSNLFSSFN